METKVEVLFEEVLNMLKGKEDAALASEDRPDHTWPVFSRFLFDKLGMFGFFVRQNWYKLGMIHVFIYVFVRLWATMRLLEICLHLYFLRLSVFLGRYGVEQKY